MIQVVQIKYKYRDNDIKSTHKCMNYRIYLKIRLILRNACQKGAYQNVAVGGLHIVKNRIFLLICTVKLLSDLLHIVPYLFTSFSSSYLISSRLYFTFYCNLSPFLSLFFSLFFSLHHSFFLNIFNYNPIINDHVLLISKIKFETY